ncbi:MAG TPA: FkbM family methyltransferase [Steroidobacteraceae bacterium]|jgi:FkbM family methyltransferase
MRTPLLKRLSRQIRGRWRSKVLAKNGFAVLADSKNGVFAVHPGDFHISRTLLERGEYDWAQITLLSTLIDAQSRLIFAGAHIGSLLVPLVRAAGTSTILAYEPSPANFRLLAMNLSLNAIQGVMLKNAALGAERGTIRFTENSINTGNSRVAVSNGEIEVPVDTLDATVPSNWEAIDLMVMDIEGSEVAAMRGGRTILARTKRLYVEFAPEQLREQGATVEEFSRLAADFFVSAYVIDERMTFIPAAEFGRYFRGLSGQRGLLRNLLFTQDKQPDLSPDRAFPRRG